MLIYVLSGVRPRFGCPSGLPSLFVFKPPSFGPFHCRCRQMGVEFCTAVRASTRAPAIRLEQSKKPTHHPRIQIRDSCLCSRPPSPNEVEGGLEHRQL